MPILPRNILIRLRRRTVNHQPSHWNSRVFGRLQKGDALVAPIVNTPCSRSTRMFSAVFSDQAAGAKVSSRLVVSLVYKASQRSSFSCRACRPCNCGQSAISESFPLWKRIPKGLYSFRDSTRSSGCSRSERNAGDRKRQAIRDACESRP